MSNWTLSLWVLKCLMELVLLYTCLTRGVRTILLLASYTFSTTLVLMLILTYLPSRFVAATHWVDVFGTLVMIFVFIQLASYVIEGKYDYLPTLYIFVGLVTSQLVCVQLNLHLLPSLSLNRLNILLWILGIFGLILTSRRFPHSVWISPIDLMPTSIIPPHQSVLVTHDN